MKLVCMEFLQYFEILFKFFNTYMVPQKNREPFFFSKLKVKKKNVLMHNIYLILRFHKNDGNGENLQNRMWKLRTTSVPVQARPSINRSQN